MILSFLFELMVFVFQLGIHKRAMERSMSVLGACYAAGTGKARPQACWKQSLRTKAESL